MLAVKVRVNANRFRVQINEAKQSLRDFRPLFRVLRDKWLIDAFRKVFSTDGRGIWPPTNRPNPILRDTRALFRSYTQEGARGNISRIGRKEFTWGSDIFYGEFHERGQGVRQRQVVGLILSDRSNNRAIEQIIERYVEGKIGGRR